MWIGLSIFLSHPISRTHTRLSRSLVIYISVKPNSIMMVIATVWPYLFNVIAFVFAVALLHRKKMIETCVPVLPKQRRPNWILAIVLHTFTCGPKRSMTWL